MQLYSMPVIKKFILLMGVSGSGKTTLGKALSARLDWPFFDGDSFHTPENIARMKNGIPLNDEDRMPWLNRLSQLITTSLEENRGGILACSALKEAYRKILLPNREAVLLVYLKGSYELIWSRMVQRPSHYMKAEMLKSQFEALEEPTDALTVDISKPLDEIVTTILDDLGR